ILVNSGLTFRIRSCMSSRTTASGTLEKSPLSRASWRIPSGMVRGSIRSGGSLSVRFIRPIQRAGVGLKTQSGPIDYATTVGAKQLDDGMGSTRVRYSTFTAVTRVQIPSGTPSPFSNLRLFAFRYIAQRKAQFSSSTRVEITEEPVFSH